MFCRPFCSAAVLLILTAACVFAAETEKKENAKLEPPSAAVDRATLEQEFASKLTGATLIGSFTIDGQMADKAPNSERYELESVTKAQGDYWVFVSRIKYGSNDVKIPLTLKVVWAGDTPMISLTDFEIPALGTFTARVMFYGDRYAGTWQHGKVGGHMFGRIEKGKVAREKSTEK